MSVLTNAFCVRQILTGFSLLLLPGYLPNLKPGFLEALNRKSTVTRDATSCTLTDKNSKCRVYPEEGRSISPESNLLKVSNFTMAQQVNSTHMATDEVYE